MDLAKNKKHGNICKREVLYFSGVTWDSACNVSRLTSQQSCLKQTTKWSSCSNLAGGLTSLSTIKGITEELFLPNPWKMKLVSFWAPDTQQAVQPVCPPRSTWKLASASCSPQPGHSAAFFSGLTLNCCAAPGNQWAATTTYPLFFQQWFPIDNSRQKLKPDHQKPAAPSPKQNETEEQWCGH